MPLFNNVLAGAAGQGGADAGYKIERSLRFNQPHSSRLSRTPSSNGNKKTFTISAWVKKSRLAVTTFQNIVSAGSGSPNNQCNFHFDNAGRISFYNYPSGGTVTSSAQFRDFSAWMHCVASIDTTQSTASDRVKIYVNGTQITEFTSNSYPSQNQELFFNSTAHQISVGANGAFDSHLFSGYIAEVHFIDGQALAPTDFGKFSADTGVWNPIRFSGNHGTNGFHLDFSDNSSNAALGTDSSGNSNNLTVYNLSVASGAGNDSLLDSPTNYDDGTNIGGNYCTLNSLKSTLTLSNGNLDSAGGSGWTGAVGTIGMSSGKFYWEIDNIVSDEHMVGVVKYNTSNVTWNTAHAYASEIGYYYPAAGGSAYGAAWAAGDVIGVAFDADNGILEFYKNGTSQGVAETGLLDGPYLPSVVQNGSSRSCSINFGQRPWSYSPKAGHVALCTTNLPDPLIADPSTAFDAIAYTGNGSSKTISGVGFTSDLIWTKCRNQARSHYLMDTVRGISKYLITDQTGAEGTNTTNRILSVTSDGWTLGTNNSFNGNNDSYVAWAWDAADSNTTISAGSLNSSIYDQSQTWSNQVSGTANSTYPFSNLFNGDNMATHAYPANGTEAVFTPNPSFSNATTVKIWYYAPNMGANGIKLNGTGVGDQLATTTGTLTKTFDVTGTGFTSLAWSKGTNSTDSGLLRIDVDGKQLVDSGVSLASVPSISSTTRANPTAGFSIVNASVAASLTGGPTVAHGLNKKPEFIIGKNRDYSIYWRVFHKDLSNNHYLNLHRTDAQQNSSAVWGSHNSLDSNVFQIGANTPASMWIPSGSDDCIFYVWTSVEGYSAFGSYEGNGDTGGDGPFVYTGMRPRWIMTKAADAAGAASDWLIFDTERDPNNVADKNLSANYAGQEQYYSANLLRPTDIDILSNGFKIRNNRDASNKSSTTYIYVAFASSPFKYSRAR